MSEDIAPERQWVFDAVQRYEQRLTAYSAKMFSGDIDAARDVVQHAFLKMCDQRREEIDGRLGQWLYTVCRNRALDVLRRKKNAPFEPSAQQPLAPSRQGPDAVAERSELVAAVQRVIQTLPQPEQEAIDLWAHGFRYGEIAEITGRKPATIRVGVHRALQKIKNHPTIQSWLADGSAAGQNGRAQLPLTKSEQRYEHSSKR